MPPPIEVRREAFKAWVRRVLGQAKAQRGLSVVDIARLSGVSDPTIYRWRNGDWKKGPDPDQVVAFCDALDINPTIAFAILWPGKKDSAPAVEPIVLDADYQTLMRKLADDGVPEFEKHFIRETLRQLADRPRTPAHLPQRTRPTPKN
jgi:transcriptional regulator with XRE-family HTH domain